MTMTRNIKFFSWIYRIAINESLNALRRDAHETPLEDEDELPSPNGRGSGDASRSRRAARRLRAERPHGHALRAPHRDHAAPLFPDCSYGEIAWILELQEKTVKSRLFEALPEASRATEGVPARMNNNDDVLQLMHAVLDREASPEQQRALDALLASDPQARERFAEIERFFTRLGRLPEQEPPPGLVDTHAGPPRGKTGAVFPTFGRFACKWDRDTRQCTNNKLS